MLGPQFDASIPPVTEGSDAVLITASDFPLEYYAADMTATRGCDYDDGGGSSATNWVAVDPSGNVAFPTNHLPGCQATRSFAVHVRAVGYPQTEVILDADIFDADVSDPSILLQTVDYAYDVFNRLVRRDIDQHGQWFGLFGSTFYSYDGDNVALQFDGSRASDLSHRYLWNPDAVDQLLADEQLAPVAADHTRTGAEWTGTVVWPLADHLGTIRDLAVYDADTQTTTVANHRVYDSFGNQTGLYNGAGNAISQADPAVSLKNYLNRWYDSPPYDYRTGNSKRASRTFAMRAEDSCRWARL